MLLILKFIARILSVLNGEISPRQIAAGFALGALIGLLPASGLLPFLLILIALIVNVNLAIFFVSMAVFALISFAVDPLANVVGYHLLAKTPALVPFWTRLYNMPVVPFTKFNNTIVLGSFTIGVILLVPLYFLGKAGVVLYRTRWRAAIQRTKIVQMAKASKLYGFYRTYRGVTGQD